LLRYFDIDAGSCAEQRLSIWLDGCLGLKSPLEVNRYVLRINSQFFSSGRAFARADKVAVKGVKYVKWKEGEHQ
jgi:hypothetical protein